MSRFQIGAILVVIGAAVLLASCPPRENTEPVAKKRADSEIIVPSMLPPQVERESIGDVLYLSTTPRGGDLIITTANWVVESARVYTYNELKKGDWVDLLAVHIDEKNAFQYLCIAETRECRRVFKIRKLVPGEAIGPRTPQKEPGPQ